MEKTNLVSSTPWPAVAFHTSYLPPIPIIGLGGPSFLSERATSSRGNDDDDVVPCPNDSVNNYLSSTKSEPFLVLVILGGITRLSHTSSSAPPSLLRFAHLSLSAVAMAVRAFGRSASASSCCVVVVLPALSPYVYEESSSLIYFCGWKPREVAERTSSCTLANDVRLTYANGTSSISRDRSMERAGGVQAGDRGAADIDGRFARAHLPQLVYPSWRAKTDSFRHIHGMLSSTSLVLSPPQDDSPKFNLRDSYIRLAHLKLSEDVPFATDRRAEPLLNPSLPVHVSKPSSIPVLLRSP
ncbi:hypothetical protein NLJ89_g5667 [Agrocybe chaxingu]|uniref:Uncharacterized protein n=1 Tax=Agrocybe chaxingu TaxID=84603 RepID=A0A9W8K7X7_9AGAR|nr:hypothetical protein NLJ89_g5667 [Agrocybe chaxingu]